MAMSDYVYFAHNLHTCPFLSPPSPPPQHILDSNSISILLYFFRVYV